MFGLGVLQVLQERRGLLFGPNAARHLSAVSGGSYISAALVANARQLAHSDATSGPSPVSVGSPEEVHILEHGKYLVTPLIPAIARFGWLFAVNAAGLVVLYIWSGMLVADFAAIFHFLWAPGWVPKLPVPAAYFVLLVCLYLLVRSMFSGRRIERYGLLFVAWGGIAWSASPAMFDLSSHERLRTIAGWLPWFGVALALMVVSVIAAQLMSKRRVMGLPAAVANWTEVLMTRLLLLGLLLYAAAAWMSTLRTAFEATDTENSSASSFRSAHRCVLH